MRLSLAAALAMLATTAPAFAAGDAAKGEEDFKKCKACHSIIGADGTEIVKGGKTGPNLFGVVGRVIGSEPEFKYGESILELKEKGTVWDEAMIAAYVTDPAAFLKEQLGEDDAKTKMTFKLTKGQEDMAAYLATLKP